MTTSQVTCKIFTCTTIHQTSIFQDSRSIHPSSDKKNGGMPYFMPSANIYQQKISGHHKNI